MLRKFTGFPILVPPALTDISASQMHMAPLDTIGDVKDSIVCGCLSEHVLLETGVLKRDVKRQEM